MRSFDWKRSRVGVKRSRMLRVALVAAAVAAVVALTTAGASAAGKPYTCIGDVSGGTLPSVSVPNGAFCDLYNVTVSGNVTVGVGSGFYASGGEIMGNLAAYRSAAVGTGITVSGPNPVDGNVTVSGTYAVYFDSNIGGSAVFTANNAVTLENMTVQGNLICRQNQIQDGYGVTVNGKDQCPLEGPQ